MPITPVEWPLRFIPRQPPRFLHALAVSLAATGAAIGVQGAFLGWPGATGFSSTFFPAFIFATLYGGSRWGWATLAFSMLLGVATPRAGPLDAAAEATIAMFAISGAATVLVASALRRTLLRLEEARRIQQEIRDALDRSEARLTLAQDAGGVGLWDWDVVTDGSHWSPTLYRNLGLPLDAEASMGTLLEAVHPDDRQGVLAANADAVNTGHFQAMEYRVVWPDGSTHWLLSRGEMLRDPETGAVTRAAGVNIDVTDRHVSFEQVRESEARFRAMADSAPVLMWVSKIDGSREFANQAYVKFLGVPYEEAIAFDWRKRLAEDDIPRILREQLIGEASRELFALEARYLRCDGEWRWMRSFSQPRYGPAGEFTGFIGIGFDVTDAKRAEADLKQINELLTERVQAALAERDQAEAALRHGQKLEAVGQLTGGVAHDFNNLLTVVIGALDLIQRHPNDADRRDRMIEAALGAARRGERLTHQLLAFSRRQALKPEPALVDDVLAEAEPLLRRAAGESVSLTFAPDAAGAVAMIDVGQFESAVMNMVVNARDAVSGGGSIRVETHACDLRDGDVPDTLAGAYVRLDVHDTGVGMDADTLSRVFDPFFTTKEVGKGTGLGLSQVYGFARQSGGGITVESAPGKGATVRLYLPRSSVPPSIAEPGPEAATAAGPALALLLVEDDASVGDMVEAMLEDMGHDVVRAGGVDAALEILSGDRPLDLMLTDLIMPGSQTGVDLAHEAVRLRPGLPVILSSGYTGEVLSSAHGAPWPLLRKPYSSEALARVMEDVVQKTPHPA